jgi:RND family efflux transporter MFP subunit
MHTRHPALIEIGHLRRAAALLALVGLTGCDQDAFVPPPPPKVDVTIPLQRTVTRYLEATGNTAPIKSVDLLARVQGFLESINYKDGDFVKEGTTLFTIEPETYKLQLEQAQAAATGSQATLRQAEADFKRQTQLVARQSETQATLDTSTSARINAQANVDQAQAAATGSQATLKQAEADFKRQTQLVARQSETQATLDTSTSARINAQANVDQAQANIRIAEINYGYTNVVAPFDGYVTSHLVSVGELVGVGSPTQLATIVALDPIYVNFNVNEQDVLRIRAEAKSRGITVAELRQLPVQAGLQTERGYPHDGKLDYISPTLNQSTGTLAVRGIFSNPNRAMLPGYFVRVRVPIGQQEKALLVPDNALGNDQGGRYLLVVNGDNVVEQRHVQIGSIEDGTLRVIEQGLKPDDRVVASGLLQAIPGQKVDPQPVKIESSQASAK